MAAGTVVTQMAAGAELVRPSSWRTDYQNGLSASEWECPRRDIRERRNLRRAPMPGAWSVAQQQEMRLILVDVLQDRCSVRAVDVV